MLFAAVHESLVGTLRHAAGAQECLLIKVDRKLSAEGQPSRFDPTEKLPVHCGNSFDAGFSPIKVLV